MDILCTTELLCHPCQYLSASSSPLCLICLALCQAARCVRYWLCQLCVCYLCMCQITGPGFDHLSKLSVCNAYFPFHPLVCPHTFVFFTFAWTFWPSRFGLSVKSVLKCTLIKSSVIVDVRLKQWAHTVFCHSDCSLSRRWECSGLHFIQLSLGLFN